MAEIFVSYSRKDKPFVEKLYSAISSSNLDVWVDWDDILPSAEWLNEILDAIRATDAFVFVISPNSLSSEICQVELDQAIKTNKRLLPILLHESTDIPVPEKIAQLNWIYFREEDDFNKAVAMLIKAFNTDLDFVHTHTRLL